MKKNGTFAKALSILLALLCTLSIPLATMLQASAAEARTPIELNKAVSVSLKTPPVAAHGPTYSFTAPETGFYTLKVSDVMLKIKKDASLWVGVLNAKGRYLASYYTGEGYYYDWYYDMRESNDMMYFVLQKGEVAIIDMLASAYTYDEEEDGYWEVDPGTLVATFKLTLGQAKATPLAQGTKTVDLNKKAPVAIYSFTPAKDGYYSFTASNNSYDLDTYAELYDSKSKLVARNDDAWVEMCMRDYRGGLEEYDAFSLNDDYNFNISEPLKAGQTYYLLTRGLSYEYGAFDLTVAPSVLKFTTDTVNIQFHRSVWFTDLIEECTYSKVVISDWFELGWMDGWMIEAYSRGTQAITFSSPDDKVSQVITFKVDYDFLQWCALILCGGFLWLDDTPVFWPGETRWSHLTGEVDNFFWNIRWRLQDRWDDFVDFIDPLYWFHDNYNYYYDDYYWEDDYYM